ncbi:helix-turn-helix domain-containing protein [Pseudomonas sp. S2.OTC.A_B10]|uniref:helix-turn-helix domain-containing protein n=1 Tax=Pseudomonas sp. S2.OTC.A_B10 TaxID=3237018 RepID=UPI003CE8D608
MSKTVKYEIRPECFRPAINWEKPTPDEVREILLRIDPPKGLSGAEAAKVLGIETSRQIRRWTGGDAPIPYAAWAILADMAGVPRIWVEHQE